MFYYQKALRNRQDACSIIHRFGGAFDFKQAFRNRQYACSTIHKFGGAFDFKQAFRNRQNACSTINKFYCGVGILPAPNSYLLTNNYD